MKTHTEAINEATGYSRMAAAVLGPDIYSPATIAAAEERLRIGNTPDDEDEYDEAPECSVCGRPESHELHQPDNGPFLAGWNPHAFKPRPTAEESAAQGIASGQPFTLEEGEKQMYVSPASQN